MPAAVSFLTFLHYAIAAHAVRRRRKRKRVRRPAIVKSNLCGPGTGFCEGAKTMLSSILFSAGLLLSALPSGYNEPVLDTLQAVVITADKGVTVSRMDTLSLGNLHSVSDALLLTSGFHVGDNGGLAGLKSLSLRGMGAAHTAVYLDGLRMGNVQSGQNDLGMIGLESLSCVIVDYAQNSVYFNTARPRFTSSPVKGFASISAGSFGTWLPSTKFDFRLSENLALSAYGSGVFSKGNFSYGDGLVRENNDVSQYRAGLDLYGIIDGGDYHVKAYYNDSERGTPGTISWPSDDRQRDRNALVQSVFRKNISALYSLCLSGKASYDDIFYSSAWGDSRYGQTEFQLNTVHEFHINKSWEVSATANIQWDGLKSTSYSASRVTAFSALATSYHYERFWFDASLEYSGAFDSDALSRNALSPSASLRFNIIEGLDISAFARRAYRIPTFNELYYVGYGNPELNPEDAWLTNLGLDFNKTIGGKWIFKAQLDGFYNILTNKITSAPTVEDPNIWMPYNIGEVRSSGIDAVLGFTCQDDVKYAFNAKYTYQSAIDKTPDSYTYGQQIPYIARNVLIIDANVSWRSWEVNPLWNLRSGRTDGSGEMSDWNTVDLILSKSFFIRKAGTLQLVFKARNLADSRYETVSGYPMPGRNFIGGITYRF